MKKRVTRAVRRAARELGRRGGSTPTDKPKGFAALSPERRRELSLRGVEARREKGRKP